MRTIMRARVWLLAALLLVVLGQPVLAQGDTGSGQVVFGQDFILHNGERLYGDLVVFGGDVTVETGSSIRGDVAAFGGAVVINGSVDGSVFAFGGDLRLGESAVVSGDVAASGDVITSPGAVVNGQTILNLRPGVPLPPVQPLLNLGNSTHTISWGFWPWDGTLGHWIVSLFTRLFDIVIAIALGILVVLVFPQPTRRVGDAITAYPLHSVGVGLLTGLAAVLVVPLLVLICIGIPVAVLVGLALAIALVFGWVAAGFALGERLLDALHQAQRQPVLAVTVGLLLLGLLAAVPCLGALAALLVGTWGLGAVVLTAFGTRPYDNEHPHVAPVTTGPAPSAPPEPADIAPEPEPEDEGEDEEAAEDDDLPLLPPLPPIDELPPGE